MKYTFAILICLLALAGCGGGGSKHALDISGSAALTANDGVNQDDSLYDSRVFTATRDGWIQVSMASATLDPYVIVYRGTTEDHEVGSDDDSGNDGNAIYIFHANDGETFTAKFTTYGSGAHLGNYTFTIKEITDPGTLTRSQALNTGKVPQDPAMKRTKQL